MCAIKILVAINLNNPKISSNDPLRLKNLYMNARILLILDILKMKKMAARNICSTRKLLSPPLKFGM